VELKPKEIPCINILLVFMKLTYSILNDDESVAPKLIPRPVEISDSEVSLSA
jgi:hypothetical protein